MSLDSSKEIPEGITQNQVEYLVSLDELESCREALYGSSIMYFGDPSRQHYTEWRDNSEHWLLCVGDSVNAIMARDELPEVENFLTVANVCLGESRTLSAFLRDLTGDPVFTITSVSAETLAWKITEETDIQERASMIGELVEKLGKDLATLEDITTVPEQRVKTSKVEFLGKTALDIAKIAAGTSLGWLIIGSFRRRI